MTGYSRVAPNDYTHAFYDYYNGLSWTGMTDLGTLTGDNTSCGNGINSNVYVVGFSGTDSNAGHCDDEMATVTSPKAWYWTTSQTQLTRITNSLGGTDAEAWAINNSNVVTGWADYQDARGNLFKHAFTCTITGTPSCTSTTNSMTDLGTVGSYNTSWAQAINSNGDVAGFVCNATHCGLPGDTDNTRQAMKTSGGTMTALDLSSLGGITNSEAKGINASGVVVGSYRPSGNMPNYSAFVYDSTSGARKLFDSQVVTHNLDQWLSLVDARAVDDNGDIVGAGTYQADQVEHWFLLTPNSMSVPSFGGKRVDQVALVPESVRTPEKMPVPQPMLTEADFTVVPLPIAAGEHLGVREPALPRAAWWEWDG